MEELSENFNKDLENIRNNHSEPNNTITKIQKNESTAYYMLQKNG